MRKLPIQMRNVAATTVLCFSFLGLAGYFVYQLYRSNKDDEEDADDDYISTVPRSSNHRTIYVKVPQEMVRALIGRNGQQIKSIQTKSNTRINFRDVASDDKEEPKERVCVVRGTSEACAMAEHMICEFIATQPIYECISIWVPDKVVGRIIGRCGEVLHDIIQTTGASVNVADKDASPTRRINIKGSLDQVRLAKSMIEDIVERHNVSKATVDEALAKREPRRKQISKTPTSPNAMPVDTAVSPVTEKFAPQTNQFEVYVSAMIDPSLFWVQIVGPKAAKLDSLVEVMTEYYKSPSNRDNHILQSISVGDLVAASFQYDEKWYRAEVLSLKPTTDKNGSEESQTQENGGDGNHGEVAQLYYVDYGDTDYVRCIDLFELRTDFLQLHFQAIECHLAGVKPMDVEWSDDAIDRFEELTHVAQWKRLSARINGYQVRDKFRAKREGSPVPGVDLFDSNECQDIDIGKDLVQRGYALVDREPSCSSISGSSLTNSITSNT